MLAVSNTSPLRYLIATGQADLLPRLFSEIMIPPGVALELQDAAAPLAVRDWIAHPPYWLGVQAPTGAPDSELSANLDRGEREAIQLATELRAGALIMDERKGREIVKRRGLPLIGALGLLGIAYQRKLIEDPARVLSEMRRHGFRISEEMAIRFQELLATRYARQVPVLRLSPRASPNADFNRAGVGGGRWLR